MSDDELRRAAIAEALHSGSRLGDPLTPAIAEHLRRRRVRG